MIVNGEVEFDETMEKVFNYIDTHPVEIDTTGVFSGLEWESFVQSLC